MKTILFFILIFPITNLFAGELKAISQPEGAEVYITNNNNGKRIKIGKTPLKIDFETVIANYSKGSTFLIEIDKIGYETYKAYVTQIGDNDLTAKANLQVSKDIGIYQGIDTLIVKLFEIQRLTRIKNYTEAMQLIANVEKEYPTVSTVQELKGSIYYLQKDFNKSLNAFRKAFSLNPKNNTAFKMKAYLERRFGKKQQS